MIGSQTTRSLSQARHRAVTVSLYATVSLFIMCIVLNTKSHIAPPNCSNNSIWRARSGFGVPYPNFGSGQLPKFNVDFLVQDTYVIKFPWRSGGFFLSENTVWTKLWKMHYLAVLKNPSKKIPRSVFTSGWLPNLFCFFFVHVYNSVNIFAKIR